jgi:cell division protein FtsQ
MARRLGTELMGARPIQALSRLSLPTLPPSQVLRRRLIFGLIAIVAIATAYLFWFRDSSFVQVRDVTVEGADSDASVASALTSAAQGMSTLHLDQDALRAVVADDPNVASLTAQPDFPHGLTIDVVVRRPAGYVADGAGAVLAADGTVLSTGGDRPDGLPEINAEATSLGARAEGPALVVARVLGAAPTELAPQIESGAVDDEHGPTVTLIGGLELRFGDPGQAERKWEAAAAVLASPDFTSARYLDLSVPSRPVAG